MSRPGFVPHPSFEERARYRDFVAEAIAHADSFIAWRDSPAAVQEKAPTGEKLARARHRCRRAIMPENQQSRTSPLFQLVQLVEAWTLLDLEERKASVDQLRALARLTASQIKSRGE